MNLILAIPLAVRLVALFVLGAIAGGFINLGAYRLAWRPRSISPWSSAPPGAKRRPSDRVPIAGWWGLRRESRLHGAGFWFRPLIVEFATGLLFAMLYYWETAAGAPIWFMPGPAVPPANFLAANVPLVEHARFLSHAILISLMFAASLIDIDEQTIPDTITVAGTLIGLSLAAIYPWSLLVAGNWLINGVHMVEFLTLTSPQLCSGWLRGVPRAEPLTIAIGCWTLWCGGLMPRRWNTRHGLVTAVRVFCHRLLVERVTYLIGLMWLVGAGCIALAWWRAPVANWAGLLTALVGMAASGGIIWAVRIVGTAVLKREAMGFGDVTLMAMIGAFIGWQPSLIVFFLAPFAGLVVGIAQWVSHRENEVPYGPFLCLAGCAVIINWPVIWDWTIDYFAMGWLLPALMAGCVAMMGILLLLYRIVRDWLVGGG